MLKKRQKKKNKKFVLSKLSRGLFPNQFCVSVMSGRNMFLYKTSKRLKWRTSQLTKSLGDPGTEFSLGLFGEIKPSHPSIGAFWAMRWRGTKYSFRNQFFTVFFFSWESMSPSMSLLESVFQNVSFVVHSGVLI